MTAPCTGCRATNEGPLRYAYLATFQAEERISHRLRLCGTCWTEYLNPLIEVAERQDRFGRWLTIEEQEKPWSSPRVAELPFESSPTEASQPTLPTVTAGAPKDPPSRKRSNASSPRGSAGRRGSPGPKPGSS